MGLLVQYLLNGTGTVAVAAAAPKAAADKAGAKGAARTAKKADRPAGKAKR